MRAKQLDKINDIKRTLFQVGLCAASHNDIEGAEQIFDFATQEFPDSELIKYGSISIYKCNEQYDKAISMITPILDDNKGRIIHSLLIQCYMLKTDFQKAKELIKDYNEYSDNTLSDNIANKLESINNSLMNNYE